MAEVPEHEGTGLVGRPGRRRQVPAPARPVGDVAEGHQSHIGASVGTEGLGQAVDGTVQAVGLQDHDLVVGSCGLCGRP